MVVFIISFIASLSNILVLTAKILDIRRDTVAHYIIYIATQETHLNLIPAPLREILGIRLALLGSHRGMLGDQTSALDPERDSDTSVLGFLAREYGLFWSC